MSCLLPGSDRHCTIPGSEGIFPSGTLTEFSYQLSPPWCCSLSQLGAVLLSLLFLGKPDGGTGGIIALAQGIFVVDVLFSFLPLQTWMCLLCFSQVAS